MNAIALNGASNPAGPSNLPVVHGLDYAFLQVRQFHQAFNHPCPDKPTMQPLEKAEARADWLREECQELQDARTLKDQADAYTDIMYFALGGMVECGLLPQAIFDCVQIANMAKLHTDADGNTYVVRDENRGGKIVKPEGWEENHAPERHIAAEIERQSITQPLNAMTA